MDWKALKEKANGYIEKATPLLDKTKEFGVKTLDFTQKQLQNTPIVLKNTEEYDLVRINKRLIVISYDENTPEGKEILLRAPIWSALAWTDNASLRFIAKNTSPDLVKHLDMDGVVSMKVWYESLITTTCVDLVSIKKWWSARDYGAPPPSLQPSGDANGIVDPLAGK